MVRQLPSAGRLRYETNLSTLILSIQKLQQGQINLSDMCWLFLVAFLTVSGPRGPPEAGVRPHCWLVVSGISALRDALRTCKCKSLQLFKCLLVQLGHGFNKLKLLFLLFCFTAPVLQSQHSWDVQQHPAQVSCAQAQCVKLRQGAARGAPAEGPHQEAGSEGWLCKLSTHHIVKDQWSLFAFSLVCWFSISFFPPLQLELKYHSFFSPINWEDLMAKKIIPPFIPSVVSSNYGAAAHDFSS